MERKEWDSYRDVKTGIGGEIFAEIRSHQEGKWQSLAGPHYKKMLESCQAAEGFLQHEDRKVRIAALGVLTFVWRPGPDDPCAAIAERMTFEGDDIQMRDAALCVFIECYRCTSEPRVARILAELLMDESQTAFRRRFLYNALYTLRGEFAPTWPGALTTPPTQFRVPEDIDWTFVKSFL